MNTMPELKMGYIATRIAQKSLDPVDFFDPRAAYSTEVPIGDLRGRLPIHRQQVAFREILRNHEPEKGVPAMDVALWCLRDGCDEQLLCAHAGGVAHAAIPMAHMYQFLLTASTEYTYIFFVKNHPNPIVVIHYDKQPKGWGFFTAYARSVGQSRKKGQVVVLPA